jgi:ABC-type glycerol-3-phosphate transport system substrate-binding protein
MLAEVGTIGRRAVLAGAASVLMLGVSLPALAQDLSGDLVILQWQGGVEADLWKDLEAAFMAANPGVNVRELVVTGQGDMRGPMRAALLGGETVDLIINTWPAFRAELADAGIIGPIDADWEANGWSEQLSDSWRDLGSIGDDTYGLTYTYGDRSAIWYVTATLEKAGVTPPTTWEEYIASFDALKAAGVSSPVAIPGKYWAHAETFETLLIRTSGVETAQGLAAREIPWTDPAVKAALMKYAEMLSAGCCGDTASMLANDWDGEADLVFQAGAKAYLQMGMWVNARARSDYGMEEGVDYSIFQFPALGMGHDDTSMVDSKELNVTTNGGNREAAIAFLDFMVTKEAADILHGYGYAVPSTEADSSQLGPVQQIATEAVGSSKVQFVLGDLLPGDLVDEYRVQLQRFLQDPSEATIDAVLAAIEAKAASAY